MELTLQKALTMARQIESAMAEAQIIGQGTASYIQAVHPVQTQDSQSSKRPLGLAVRGTSDERSPPTQRKTCYRCGSVNQTANYYGWQQRTFSTTAAKREDTLLKYAGAPNRFTK